MGVVRRPAGDGSGEPALRRDTKERAANALIVGLIVGVQLAWLAAFACTVYRLVL